MLHTRFAIRRFFAASLPVAVALFVIVFACSVMNVLAQGTGFVYQGKLSDTGTPQTGLFDFTFKLCSDSACTSQIGSTVIADDVTVTNGVFKTSLDFGSAPFSANTGQYLEIAVRPGASTGAYTTLTPRQHLTSLPYAIQSLNATQLGGVAADQYVTTTAAGTNFIQNTTSPQSASNFNISGTGIANIFDAVTQFNIGGSRVFSIQGNSNTTAGLDTGTLGSNNSFFGASAGRNVTTGYRNAFFGTSAGRENGDGQGNSFFGYDVGRNNFANENSFFGISAGASNTSGGDNAFFGGYVGFSNAAGFNNSFFGTGSGFTNSSGSENTFIGHDSGKANTTGSSNVTLGENANVSSGTLTNATAIGAKAFVSQSNALVLGSINAVNGAIADTNVGIGTTAPVSRLHLNNNPVVTFTNSANTVGRQGYRIAFDNDRLTFQQADDAGNFAANQIAIAQSTGNLGIGTTGPLFKLHVRTATDQNLVVRPGSDFSASLTGIGLQSINDPNNAYKPLDLEGSQVTLNVGSAGNVGIGTADPHTKLQVAGGSIYVANPGSLVITSPNGACWFITVNNAGALSTISTPCP